MKGSWQVFHSTIVPPCALLHVNNNGEEVQKNGADPSPPTTFTPSNQTILASVSAEPSQETAQDDSMTSVEYSISENPLESQSLNSQVPTIQLD